MEDAAAVLVDLDYPKVDELPAAACRSDQIGTATAGIEISRISTATFRAQAIRPAVGW